MLDIGWSEIIVIAVVMIVIVGPKDLPKMLRAFGKATARMRTTANEFKRQFDDALKEAELDDVKTIIDETRKLDPRGKMTQVFDPIRTAGNDLKASLNQSTKPQSSEPETSVKPVDSAVYKGNAAEITAKEEKAQVAAAVAKAPSEAIAEAVKKNLSDKVTTDSAKPAKVKAASSAKTSSQKAVKKPAAKKAATSKKVTAKKAPAKKTAVKTPVAEKITGTDE